MSKPLLSGLSVAVRNGSVVTGKTDFKFEDFERGRQTFGVRLLPPIGTRTISVLGSSLALALKRADERLARGLKPLSEEEQEDERAPVALRVLCGPFEHWLKTCGRSFTCRNLNGKIEFRLLGFEPVQVPDSVRQDVQHGPVKWRDPLFPDVSYLTSGVGLFWSMAVDHPHVFDAWFYPQQKVGMGRDICAAMEAAFAAESIPWNPREDFTPATSVAR